MADLMDAGSGGYGKRSYPFVLSPPLSCRRENPAIYRPIAKQPFGLDFSWPEGFRSIQDNLHISLIGHPDLPGADISNGSDLDERTGSQLGNFHAEPGRRFFRECFLKGLVELPYL